MTRRLWVMTTVMLLAPVLRGETDFWFGPGYQGGDVTYSIGGDVWIPGEGSFVLPDKISELSFPLDGPVLQGGFTTRFHSHWEASVGGSIMLGDPSEPSVDSDWDDDGEIFIYSESDASLDAFDIDVACRRWLGWKGLDIAIGAGLLYQSQSWELDNLDQWYPPYPSLGHDTVDGLVGSYEAEMLMPYLDIAARGAVREWSLWGRVMLSPYTSVDDVDDHKLRSILATTSATGVGGGIEGSVRRHFSGAWFAELRGRFIGYYVTGTEYDTTYDGPFKGETWQIDHDIVSTQLMGTLAVGVKM
jgi:hypothetical protein